MKIITEPSVFLVGQSSVNRDELQRMLDELGASSWTSDAPSDAELLVENGGRICYLSHNAPRPGGNKAYIDHILEVGHGSVTEAAVYTFVFTGISRSLSHEIVRHRHLSPSQLSQRYVDESVAEYVVPPDLQEEFALWRRWQDGVMNGDEYRQNEAGIYAFDQWYGSVSRSHRTYVNLVGYLSKKLSTRCPLCGKACVLESMPMKCPCGGTAMSGTELRKSARQAARSVLPNATETKIQMTGNARAWRNVIELRASKHADPEIRILAVRVWDALKAASSNLFSDYEPVTLPDGTTEVKTDHPKV
jgi:thymidylate synthase (FAD)